MGCLEFWVVNSFLAALTFVYIVYRCSLYYSQLQIHNIHYIHMLQLVHHNNQIKVKVQQLVYQQLQYMNICNNIKVLCTDWTWFMFMVEEQRTKNYSNKRHSTKKCYQTINNYQRSLIRIMSYLLNYGRVFEEMG